MGYSTDFESQFTLDRPLAPEHQAYLLAFAGSRRMKRDAKIAETLPDPVRLAAKLPIGSEGAFYVGSADQNLGQVSDASILDYNGPPGGAPYDSKLPWPEVSKAITEAIQHRNAQPGLWCHWEPTSDGTAIQWNGSEKFTEYVPWLKYLITNFLSPWSYKLNGEVEWKGEDPDDLGKIVVNDNNVKTLAGHVAYTYTDQQ